MKMKALDVLAQNVFLMERGELERAARIEVEVQAAAPASESAIRKADGTAIINISGVIAPRDSWMLRLLGGTSIEQVLANFNSALADPSVESIMLNIDSPGGSVAGVSDLASRIYEARAQKPVVAFTSGYMASAAYWIGAAASAIVVGDTATLGSIGVLAVIADDRGRQTRDGVVFHEIISSGAPNKRPDPATDAGRAVLQGNVDAIEEVFVGAVARFRGVSTDRVLTDFGRGGVLIGAQAVRAGLADAVGTFDGTLRAKKTSNQWYFSGPAPIASDAKSQWNRSPELRAEFGTFERYAGYLKHEELCAQLTRRA